ncbi:hypothetical protein V6C53_11875 [Desulfocurvibacter africanus]|uniref:hypothetical protein n=1 Tax=Desulfocurvibacter africanus TaxID=873 RepID=UPI002FDADE1F
MSNAYEKFFLAAAEHVKGLWAAQYDIHIHETGSMVVAQYDDNHGNAYRLVFETRDLVLHATDLLQTAVRSLANFSPDEIDEARQKSLEYTLESPLPCMKAAVQEMNDEPILMLNLGPTTLCFHLYPEAVDLLKKSLNSLQPRDVH